MAEKCAPAIPRELGIPLRMVGKITHAAEAAFNDRDYKVTFREKEDLKPYHKSMMLNPSQIGIGTFDTLKDPFMPGIPRQTDHLKMFYREQKERQNSLWNKLFPGSDIVSSDKQAYKNPMAINQR